MTKHLFKLKKDGKTVGYLRFAKYSDGGLRIQLSLDNFNWDDDPDLIDYDSAHLFVTKDKNGKDVFAEDFCRIGDPFGGIGSTVEGYVRWTDAELTWRIEWNDRRGDTISMLVSAITDIELIEDEDDD